MEANEENRKKFRHMMFTADKKISENLGGVILHHETIYQTDSHGKRIVDGLTDRGILKVYYIHCIL